MKVEFGGALHFYQPERKIQLPGGGLIEVVPEINEKIWRQVYRNLLAETTLDGTAFSFFTTLRGWIKDKHPSEFKEIKSRIAQMPDANLRVLGDPFLHIILPFMTRVDLDILLSAGRIAMREDLNVIPLGLWLPECAVSTMVLEAAFDHGYRFVVLMDNQINGGGRNPVNISLSGGREMRVMAADKELSGRVAHNDEMTVDGPRFLEMIARGGTDKIFATDGETFGHHKPDRDWFARWVFDSENMAKFGIKPLEMSNWIRRAADQARLLEGTSWSCVHQLGRWMGDCPCGEPSYQRLMEKRKWHNGLLERKQVITGTLNRESPGWQRDFGRTLAENRHYLFNDVPEAVNQIGLMNVGERKIRLMEAYQLCLVGFTSCAAFFGSDDSVEKAYARDAIEAIDRLNVI